MSDSDASTADLFANSQKLQTKIRKSQGQLDYPKMIFFKWVGKVECPFVIVDVADLDPLDVETNWMTGVLSPKSREKSRQIKSYKDFSVSVFAKVGKSMFYIFRRHISLHFLTIN